MLNMAFLYKKVCICCSLVCKMMQIVVFCHQKGTKRKSEATVGESSSPKKSALEKVRGTPKAGAASGSRQSTPKPAARSRQGTPQKGQGRGRPRKSPVNGRAVKSPLTMKSPAKAQAVKSPLKSPSKGTSWLWSTCSVS